MRLHEARQDDGSGGVELRGVRAGGEPVVRAGPGDDAVADDDGGVAGEPDPLGAGPGHGQQPTDPAHDQVAAHASGCQAGACVPGTMGIRTPVVRAASRALG